MQYTIEANGKTYQRKAWTGGSVPDMYAMNEVEYRNLVQAFVDDQIKDCGGLDLWECAGTSSSERMEIFVNRAKLDAWATLNH